MKKYKIIPTREQTKIIKAYWEKFIILEDEFFSRLKDLELDLEHETKIKGIEFFSCDGEYCGIGNNDRTMKLIHFR
jgi:hypothetical protein